MSNREQDYIASLTYTCNAPAAPEKKVVPAAKSVKPLQQHITELMRSLPPHQRNRPWSMVELIQRLEARRLGRLSRNSVGSKNAAGRVVGTALACGSQLRLTPQTKGVD